MAKMHELLAVEKDIIGRAANILNEAIHTFKNRAVEFYTGRHKEYRPFNEEDRDLLPVEDKAIVDTVPAKLEYVAGPLAEEIDWLFQKESTNRNASADLVVDEIVFGRNLPATYLLGLIGRLKKFRQLVLDAPTLPNGLVWIPAQDMAPNIHKLEHPLVTYRTRQTPYAFQLAEATREHKAQVIEKVKNDTVGEFTEMQWDSRVTSAFKSTVLERVDKVLLELEKAVRRANDVDVVDGHMGKALYGYLLHGKDA